MPPKKKHEQARDTDVILEEAGEWSVMQSAGGGVYMTGPAVLSVPLEDAQEQKRVRNSLPAAKRANFDAALKGAKARTKRGGR